MADAEARPREPPRPLSKGGYRPALDGVRGVAILSVVSLHAFGWPAEGALGVDLFFVLSGFLITSLLLERAQSGDGGLGRFYARRALRLLPALFAMLAAYIAWTAATDVAALEHALVGCALAVGYVANVTGIWHPELIPRALRQIWSLSQEGQFYVLWPPALLVLASKRPRLIPRLLLALIVAVALERFVIATLAARSGEPFPLYRIYFGPDTHSEPILIGCLLGVYFARNRLPAFFAGAAFRVLGWASAAFVLAAILLFDRVWTYLFATPLFTVFAGAAGLFILSAATDPGGVARLLTWRPLVFTGRISYSLYVWHLLVLAAIVGHADPHFGLRPVIGLAASAIVATVSFYFVERPFLRLKERAARNRAVTTRARQVAQAA